MPLISFFIFYFLRQSLVLGCRQVWHKTQNTVKAFPKTWWFSFFSLFSAGITGLWHYTWLFSLIFCHKPHIGRDICCSPATMSCTFQGRGMWIKNVRQTNRDSKETQTHRLIPRGQLIEYWICPHLFSICLYTLIQKGGKMTKGSFNMTQRITRTVTCFSTWDIKPLFPE